MTTTATRTEARTPVWIALRTMVRTEACLVARDTAGMIIPLALPLLILIMNGLGVDSAAVPGGPDAAVLETIIVPVTIGLVITMIAVVNMPSFIATYRTSGVLRRLAVTPVHPVMVLTAQAIVSVVHATVGIAVALAVGVIAFDIGMPGHLGGAVAALVLGAVSLYALGMLVAAVAPSANGALAIGLLAFFAMMALGGAFGPRENLPGILPTIGEFTPFGATVDALARSWIGVAPAPEHLLALTIWTVVAAIAAWRTFKWE